MEFLNWFENTEKRHKSYQRHGYSSSMNQKDILRFISDFIKKYPESKILDFGAGKDACITELLKSKNISVDAHELPQNRTKKHSMPKADSYDLVFAAQVLNVQGSEENLVSTLHEIHGFLKNGGIFLASIPEKPNENRFSFKILKNYIEKLFFNVKFTKVDAGFILRAEKHD